MAVLLPELLVPDAAAWRDWLVRHHDAAPGVRLVLHKNGGAVTTLTYAQALDEALCVGWIDGQAGSRDEGSYLQRFTPRTSHSRWSARNVQHVARLEREGRMLPAGRAAVEAAKADGRWDAAYPGPATATTPDDFAAALAASPAAQDRYDGLTSQNRWAFLYRLSTIRTAATRSRRIAEFVAMLERGELFHPQGAGPRRPRSAAPPDAG
ncbi:YdeI/OmpD-associated family protein [Nakamurella endophytica]|uniref:Bacteriocin-protection protein n=1 Tax=Nakamurella endophytica TaxID=1748367 RepID=A0A917SWG8_9ACTN|nr:YdeI/OmpD-associated family protein [Nakamurella endophytica]GGL99975.1 hypothetical protein GCM10011594_20010 [Nakamurella endophytica]